MVAIPFGLSVHHFISTVGADVGFASLIGLALLVLLFFSQAREAATLRARADEADRRIEELEGELAGLGDQVAALPAEISVRAASPRVAAAYGAVQAGATVAAGAGMHLPPAAPAGVAAPALAAATRLIPDPEHLPAYEPAVAPAHANGASRPVAAASAATIERPVPAQRVAAPPRPVAAPPRSGAPGRGPGGTQRVGGPQYGGPSRPSGAPVRRPPRRSRGRLALGALVGLLAVAAVVAGVIVLTGGKSHSTASRSSTSASLASHRTRSLAAVQPSTVTVSVLNGTDRSGLALDIANRLKTGGYRKGAVSNAADQTHTSTVVAYMSPSFRRDALAVATALKLSSSAVQLIDATTKAIACPPSQACTSAVVVTVGTDLAQ